MKAYVATDEWSGVSLVVFAETRAKAKEILLRTEEFDRYSFIELKVYRIPKMDAHYKGNEVADWFDPETRIALVRECGFSCIPDAFNPDDCPDCPAKEFCDEYKDYLRETEK